MAENANIDKTAELLLTLPEGFEIWRINPLALLEQDKNARVQSPAKFKSLVRNIKARGGLESLPLVARREDRFFIISGTTGSARPSKRSSKRLSYWLTRRT
jgi:hypothetical protein